MNTRKGLIVGIDFYKDGSPLHGCVNDACSMKKSLERNADGSKNFDTKLLTAQDCKRPINRKELREEIDGLFQYDSEVALFYFAGHGYIDNTGGFLCPSDSKDGNDGIPLTEVITMANKSEARHKVIILDSCHSGVASQHSILPLAELSDGITILTASTEDQYASEKNKSGVFTSLLVHALDGAASNIMGDVTPSSAYALIDQSLGPWEQRPVFRTNVKTFISLRKTKPLLDHSDLIKICDFFPEAGHEHQLDPSYEPERSREEPERTPEPNPDKNSVFEILQKMNRINMVVPVGASKEHMWHAAMESKKCILTPLGEHYRRLVERNRI